MPNVAVEPSRSLPRSWGSWAMVAIVGGFSVVLAVAATAAMATATIGEADAPPSLPEPAFYGLSIVMWAAVGLVAGFSSGVLGRPRGARWVGLALVATLGIALAAAGDSPAWTGAAAALVAGGVVAGSRVGQGRDGV